MKYVILIAVISMFAMLHTKAQNSLVGVWEGGIAVPGGQLKIVFKIDKSGEEYSGTLDIPQQGARGLRLNPVSQNGDSVLMVFSAGQITGTFSGVFESETEITGTYSQGGPSTTFSVERTATNTADPEKPDNERDYVIDNDGIKIGGTLAIPKGEIKGPLLIMSSGSGAQDRDSNVFDFKIFAVIAQHLAEQGIPSFRYDDRGVGKSTGVFADASLDDLTSDVYAIIDYFKNESDQKFERFAVLGHSQGGVVAGKAASEREEIDQLILMGSTAPALSDILRYQVNLAYMNTPVKQELIDNEVNARENLMRAIVKEEGVDAAKENYIKSYTNVLNGLPEVQKSQIPDIPAMVNNQTAQLVAAYDNPQMKSLLFYVPTDDLEKVDIPTLVLFGGKDTQVTITQNQGKIRDALEASGTDYEFKVYDEANHLFQKANTGMVSEYPILEKAFIDGFLEAISNWMLSKSN